MGYGDYQCMDENGIREDGRKADEMRPVEIECGVVPVADGSAYIKWGKNEAIAAVMGQWRRIRERFNAKIERF